jgi:enamine deaminase RidA (YjgF/YER057c/UK114 family)
MEDRMPRLLLLLLTACAMASVPALAQERQMEMIGPVAASAYSAAVKAKGGTLVFLASMEPVDEQGNLVAAGDFAGQTAQVWKNMDRALKLAGGSLDDVVTMTVFTTERRWGEQFTEMRKNVFKKGFPSSAFMEAAKLRTPGAFVAIRAIAVIPQ